MRRSSSPNCPTRRPASMRREPRSPRAWSGSTTSGFSTTAAPTRWCRWPRRPPQARAFISRAAIRVVFYGDSITEQNLYNQYVELYTATRFPHMRVHFFDAGVGGDRVTGGGGGPIDQRLDARCVCGEADRRHHHAGHERRRLSRHHAGDREHLRQRLRAHPRLDPRTCAGCARHADRAVALRRCDRAAHVPRRLQRGDAALRRYRQGSGAEARRGVRQFQSVGGCGRREGAGDGSANREAAGARSRPSRSAGALGHGGVAARRRGMRRRWFRR